PTTTRIPSLSLPLLASPYMNCRNNKSPRPDAFHIAARAQPMTPEEGRNQCLVEQTYQRKPFPNSPNPASGGRAASPCAGAPGGFATGAAATSTAKARIPPTGSTP